MLPESFQTLLEGGPVLLLRHEIKKRRRRPLRKPRQRRRHPLDLGMETSRGSQTRAPLSRSFAGRPHLPRKLRWSHRAGPRERPPRPDPWLQGAHETQQTPRECPQSSSLHLCWPRRFPGRRLAALRGKRPRRFHSSWDRAARYPGMIDPPWPAFARRLGESDRHRAIPAPARRKRTNRRSR